MVDRVALLNMLPNRASLPATPELEFHQLLDEAIAIALAELDLQDARALSSHAREEIEGALRDVLKLADLKKVAKRWEPKRKIENGISENRIADALVELLHSQREPYEYRAIPLIEARNLRSKAKEALAYSIGELAPVADLTKLAKLWDKENKALLSKTAERKQVATTLLALLAGDTEPMQPPPKPPKARKAGKAAMAKA